MLETSLSLHRIYGVAYLPGTALKRTGSDYNILFVSQTCAGFIQFHDMLFPLQQRFARRSNRMCLQRIIRISYEVDKFSKNNPARSARGEGIGGKTNAGYGRFLETE